jgi:hypothetical protein
MVMQHAACFATQYTGFTPGSFCRYWTTAADGIPTASNQTSKGNDAVLSLQGPQVLHSFPPLVTPALTLRATGIALFDPSRRTHLNSQPLLLCSPFLSQYDKHLLEHHRNFTLSDVRIDVPVGRIVGLGLHGSAGIATDAYARSKGSTVDGLTISKIVSSHPLAWFATNTSSGAAAVPGQNFLCAEGHDWVRGVEISEIKIAGKAVKRDSDWGMVVLGNVSAVAYL